MPWLAVLPLIVDGVRAVLKLITQIQDPDEQGAAKQELKGVLDDYGNHGDVHTLKSNLAQVGR